MVPSIDSYIYKEMDSRLSVILRNRYIIDEVLKDMDKEARSNFIESFCGEKPKEKVDISYMFPQAKEQAKARVVVQLGDGSEQTKSLGGVEGNFSYKEGKYLREISTISEEGDRLYIEVENEIGYFDSSPQIAFSEDDEVSIEGNRLYFRYDATLVGIQVEVYYASQEDMKDQPYGLVKGFTVKENVSVVGISTNIDTARCLDLIIKVILITMRDNLEEQSYYSLQTVSYGSLSTIETNLDQPIFGRPCNIEFIVSYGVEFEVSNEIKNIILKERSK